MLDWKDRWLEAGRSVLPVIPSHLETRALGAAVDRALSEGLGAVVVRHRSAAAATRAALAPLGLQPWARRPDEAAAVATLVRAPAPGPVAIARACRAAAPDGAATITPAPAGLFRTSPQGEPHRKAGQP